MSTTWNPQAPSTPPLAPPAPPTTSRPSGIPTSTSAGIFDVDAQPGTRPTQPSSPPYADTHQFSAPFRAPMPPPPPPAPSSPPSQRAGGGRRVAIGLLAAAALLSTGYVARDLTSPDTTSVQTASSAGSATPASLPSGETPKLSGDSAEPAADVAAAVSPAVVQINTESGLGSGTIYDASGLILTNNHVISGQSTVTVRLADGSSYEGQVLGTDSRSDIAVVQIRADKDLPVAQLAPDDAAVGETAIALGSPFGLTGTVTSGIISAVDRPVANELGVAVNMLQTDAPINPGNSGGALANRYGQIIGVPTSIFSQSGENNGIGFAIPIDTAKKVADKIVNGESLAAAQLGVAGSQTAADQVGALVGKVSGAAAEAGIEAGDVIVSVDGQAVASIESLQGIIGTHSPGDVITVEVDRDGTTKTFKVTLGAASASSSGSGSRSGSGQSQTNPFGN